MATCSICSKKINLFQPKFKHYDDNGNVIIYCSECNLIREEKKNTIRIEKTSPYLEKYFLKCSPGKKVAIRIMYSDEEIYDKIGNHNLEALKEHYREYSGFIEYTIKNRTYDDLDSILNLKEYCKNCFEFIDDLENLFKMLKKKDIDTNYKEIIKLLNTYIEEAIYKEHEDTIKPEVVRISNILKTNISIDNVIKEFLRTPLDIDVDIDIVKVLLDKFQLQYDEATLESLLINLREEVDIEKFEESMGESKIQIIGDFIGLSGSQFENYLKKLFEALDYTVIRTPHSADQGADLIISKDNILTVVQAKKYQGKVTNKAIQEVVASQKYYHANKAMVVTDSEFTNSAVQLALSNNVELWDGLKLKNVIEEINSKKIINLHGEKILDPNSTEYDCPYCHSKFNIPDDELPEMNESVDLTCPYCNMIISILMREKYRCIGCESGFNSIEELKLHEKSCEDYKIESIDRCFDCPVCKSELILDDAESEAYRISGYITLDCPTCHHEIRLE